MSSLSVLYERPVSRAWVAEGERIRRDYERQQAKRIEGAKRYAERQERLMLAKALLIPEKRVEAPRKIVKLCLCGCGKPINRNGNAFRQGHKIGSSHRSDARSWPEIAEQVSRIPDTELGRLAKRCLLRELGL